MKIKKNDKVLIISGKDRGKTGKVLRVFPKEGKILVEGGNIVKKHQKPKRQGEKGQVIQLPKPIDASNVKIICPNCGKASRIGYRVVLKNEKQKTKTRICKKCDQVLS